ncbi:MAG TPA: hypothetical protein PLY89_04660 [Synergistaceae bacterium]|nr:hypothetical protein [Synergistaceae bacterium]
MAMEVQGKALEWFYCLLLREARGAEDISATELHRQVSLKKTADLKPLTEGGLVEITRRGRSKYAAVTDEGWRWAHAHLGAMAERVATKRGLTRGDREMLAFLFRVVEGWVQKGGALASIFAPAPPEDGDPIRRIIDVMGRLAKSQGGDRLPLALVKGALAPWSPDRVDALLLGLLKEGRVSLEANNDVSTLTDEDRRAAIRIGASDKHVVVLMP